MFKQAGCGSRRKKLPNLEAPFKFHLVRNVPDFLEASRIKQFTAADDLQISARYFNKGVNVVHRA